MGLLDNSGAILCTEATEKLMPIQQQLEVAEHMLIQSVATHWNSVFFICCRDSLSKRRLLPPHSVLWGRPPCACVQAEFSSTFVTYLQGCSRMLMPGQLHCHSTGTATSARVIPSEIQTSIGQLSLGGDSLRKVTNVLSRLSGCIQGS